MRAIHPVAIVIMCLGLPITAAAQYTTGQSTTTTTSVNTAGDNQWMASGFAGSNFANNADPASPAFGGSIGYLWKSRWGAEFDAGFTPNFDLQSNFFGLGVKPMVNSYMANAVAAMPVGPDRNWQPFIALGVGAISLRSGLTASDVGASPDATFNPDATRFGGDIGAGLMGFVGNFGFKADLQYLRAAGSYQTSAGQYTPATGTGTTPSGSTTPTPGTTPPPGPGPYVARDASTSGNTSSTSLADTALSGLHFWRANIGVALRW